MGRNGGGYAPLPEAAGVSRWVPAFAGMTGVGTVRGGWRNAIQIPAFAGMTEGARGMIGVRGRGNVRNHGVYGASAGYADCS